MRASKELIYFYVSLSYFHLPQLLFSLQTSAFFLSFFLSLSLCRIFSFPPSLILIWSPSNPGSSPIITHQILISMFFGCCPPAPHPHAPSSSSSLCFIHSPNSSFLLFISFLISFQRQREASKALLSLSCGAWRHVRRRIQEHDAYCHDNVFFSFCPGLWCHIPFSPLFPPGNYSNLFSHQKPANHRCFGLFLFPFVMNIHLNHSSDHKCVLLL